MKKTLIILAVLGIAALTLGAAGYVYAQSQTPPAIPGGKPPMGAAPFGGMHGGPHSFDGEAPVKGAAGPLHEYMLNALADAFGLTPEELETMHDEGITLMDYAAEQGMTVADFQAAMESARDAALEQALADGVITQEQANWMAEHAPRTGHHPAGGDCQNDGPHGHPGGRFPHHGGGDWQPPQPPVQTQP